MSNNLGRGMNLNTIIIPICTFILIAAISWVGHTASTTHDTVIRLEADQVTMKTNIGEIRSSMLTRTDLSVELLKLQLPPAKGKVP